MILLIDNYDSFTYNLVQCIETIVGEGAVTVKRHDQVSLPDIDRCNPDYLIISPGPGTPDDAGVSLDAIRHCAGRIPILGVCLGHQCIAQAFGGSIVRAARLMHGKTSQIQHDGKTIFVGLPNPFTATRYHSLCAEDVTLPPCFTVSARAADEMDIMAFRHNNMPIEGVQFHPESFLTTKGPDLIRNFLSPPSTNPPQAQSAHQT
jgi:para-aminobenzoate synthetase component 2